MASWLLQALQQVGAEQQYAPRWQHGKGKGSEKGKGKAAAMATIRNPEMKERPIPPWLAAATGKPASFVKLGANGGPPKIVGRLRISPQRRHGKIAECNSMMAWIKPDEPIDHPDAKNTKKGLYLAAADTLPKGLELSKGMEVTFFVYSDGTRLGAESCMAFKGSSLGSSEPKEEKAKAGKGKEKGAGVWTWVPSGKEKSTGKGKVATKSAPGPSPKSATTKFDKRISTSSVKGTSKCPEGHFLIEIPPPYNLERTCDKCGADFRKGFTAQFMDYDECGKCCSAQKGTKIIKKKA